MIQMDKSAKNCWEFWNCPAETKKNCSAYLVDLGSECWMATGGLVAKFQEARQLNRHFEDCSECEWYKRCMDKRGRF